MFTLFIAKIKKMTFLQLELVEFDSFNEPIVDRRKITVRRTLRQMQPKTQIYDVFTSGPKTLGWKIKKLTKKLSLEPSGRVTLLWETEDYKDIFMLNDVSQIIWTDIS